MYFLGRSFLFQSSCSCCSFLLNWLRNNTEHTFQTPKPTKRSNYEPLSDDDFSTEFNKSVESALSDDNENIETVKIHTFSVGHIWNILNFLSDESSIHVIQKVIPSFKNKLDTLIGHFHWRWNQM